MDWGPGLNQKEKVSWALPFISVSGSWQQGDQMPPAPDTMTSHHDGLDPPKLQGKIHLCILELFLTATLSH